jgi:putative membrane protein
VHGAAAYSEQDAAFLRAAHQTNLAEIAGGGIAQQKGSASVRQLGALFVRDHTALDADLTRTARALGVTLPDTPTRAQLELAKRYQAAPAGTFDRLFLRTQRAAHQEALAAGATEAARGENADVKQLATAADPVVRRHLAAIRAVLRRH